MLKDRSFRWLSKHRNPWGIRSINRRLTENLAVHLQRLAREKVYLSSDRIREERLQQLAEQAAQLRRDYLSGALGPSQSVPQAAGSTN